MTDQLDLFADIPQPDANIDSKKAALEYIAKVEEYAQKESKGYDHALFVCIDSEDFHLFLTSVPHLHKCKPYSAFLKGKPIILNKNLPK